jgi:hypothetical protein
MGDSRLIGAIARENHPGNAGELFGERDRQHVAVQQFSSLLDPGPQPPHRCARALLENDVRGLHEQCSQVLVVALGDLAQDCAIPRRLLLRHEPQPSANVAALLESGAITAALEMIGRSAQSQVRSSVADDCRLAPPSFDFGRHKCARQADATLGPGQR